MIAEGIVVAINTKEGKDFVGFLRSYMRDSDEHNNLEHELSLTDNELAFATYLMIQDFHSTPPLLDRAMKLKELLSAGLVVACLKMATARALEMRFQQQERNELRYTDGNRSESVNDKALAYKDTAARFDAEARKLMERWKIAYNVNSGLNGNAGLLSDYSIVNIEI